MHRHATLLASLVCCLACSSGAAAVYGGAPAAIRSAPWAVAVVQRLPSGKGFLCSGTIIDPRHVVTAAHCVFDDRGARAKPASLLVKAGTARGLADAASPGEQDRVAAAVRVHPGFSFDPTLHTAADDVAVVELREPLALGGPAPRAVVLPRPGRGFPAGREFLLAGFGAKRPAAKSDGVLSAARGTFSEQGVCVSGRNELIRRANAVVICGVAPTGGTCEADSGSGLVDPTSRTLLGVLNGGECAPRGAVQGAYVRAPEILSFLQGSDHPPAAPRVRASTFVRLAATPSLLHCLTGGWSGRPRLTYAFVRAADGRVLQHGPLPTLAVSGRAALGIACRVTATTAGGSATLLSSPAAPAAPTVRVVLAPPLAPVAAHPGKPLTVRVVLQLETSAPLSGRFGVCAEPPAALAGRTCATTNATSRRSGDYPVALELMVSTRARPGLALVPLTGYAGSQVARGTLLLRVANR